VETPAHALNQSNRLDRQPEDERDGGDDTEDGDALRALFAAEGLLRYMALGDASGAVVETERGPLVALGPSDDDFVWPPNPDHLGYPGTPLCEMTLDQYNIFLYRWLEAAVRAGDVRCAYCGKPLCDADDLPDVETWDAIFVERELVAWMAVHFDCKRWIGKKLKGMHPFELAPQAPPAYDLSALDPALTERPDDAEHSQEPIQQQAQPVEED
jgi:hypothetical protein